VVFADVSRSKKRQNGPGFTDKGCAFTLTAGDTPGVLEPIALYNEATLKVSEGVWHTLRARTSAGGVPDAVAIPGVSNALCSNDYKGSKADKGLGQPLIPEVAHTLKAEGFDASEDGTGRGTPIVMAPAFSKRPGQQIATRDDGSSFALTSGEPPRVLAATAPIAFAQNSRDEVRLQAGDGSVCGALAAEPGMKQTTYIQQGYAVRRLTPRECERLQGFPDDWTLVQHRGKPAADGPRYKAIGNSMAVNVMRFIGERIQAVCEVDS
jgi:DNA (cytosine-5)-methyltransferase 1